MLKNLGLIFAFFVCLFLYSKFGPSLPIYVNQVATSQPAPFTVTAEGKVTAVPDVAQITLGFTTSGSSVSQVQNLANQTINNVSAAVKKLGIGESDIKTTNYNLRQDYERKGNYVIDVNLTVKVKDFAKLNQVIDAATANGANQVGGLNFTFDDPEKFQSQARKIAIANAKKKAAEIAGESGITLGRLINVSENSGSYPRPMAIMSAAEKDSITPTQVEPGSSEITSSVTLSYETG